MRTRPIATSVALALILTGAPASAHSPERHSPVTRWAAKHAAPVPEGGFRPGPDLAVISRAAAGAAVIGLGEPGHTISEITVLQSRYLRHLVTRERVRAVALELDWSLGTRLDEYVRGSRDDLDVIMSSLEHIWRTAEVRDALVWLRHHNDTHADDVRVAGVEYFATGPIAYDAVEAHVARYAPDRLAELREHLHLLRPTSDNIGEHLWTYLGIADKTPYLAASAAVLSLVSSLDAAGAAHEVALQHARQIRWWYEGFSLPWEHIPDYRDAKAAENVRWWQRFTGARTLYWAASAHVAVAPRVTITEPGQPDTVFASVGSHLERWYGPAYVPIGLTFDRGTYRTADGTVVELPAAGAGWFEQPLGDVPRRQFALALDRPTPPEVRAWLDAPLVTRGLPEYGDASTASGGTLADWFDVLVHTQVVSPARPVAP